MRSAIPEQPSMQNEDRTPSTAPETSVCETSTNEDSEKITETFDLEDLALLHHWSISTSLNIMAIPPLDLVWQKVLPQIACKCAFLMHALMSVTALHMGYLHPDRHDAMIIKASEHHNKSVQQFSAEVPHINTENCHQVYGLVALNIVYVFTAFRQHDKTVGESPGGRSSNILELEWIRLIRSIGGVIRPFLVTIMNGPLGPLLTHKLISGIQITDSTPVDLHLQSLRDIWSKNTSLEETENCEAALLVLRKVFQFVVDQKKMPDVGLDAAHCKRDFTAPFAWLHLVPEGFLTLLYQRKPSALVMFAHFGAMVQQIRQHWWLKDWGLDAVKEVDMILGPHWMSWLQWPKVLVGLSSSDIEIEKLLGLSEKEIALPAERGLLSSNAVDTVQDKK
jgi:hypothetical protein